MTERRDPRAVPAVLQDEASRPRMRSGRRPAARSRPLLAQLPQPDLDFLLKILQAIAELDDEQDAVGNAASLLCPSAPKPAPAARLRPSPGSCRESGPDAARRTPRRCCGLARLRHPAMRTRRRGERSIRKIVARRGRG